jgi:phosphoglycerate dehydrogenase-like enzyme
MNNRKYKIAVLDDYQQVAMTFADWAPIMQGAEVTVFSDHLFEEAEVVNRLNDFDVICVMRERTPLKEVILKQLPQLKLIVSTGTRNASIDLKSAELLGIQVSHTGYVSSGAHELTWALLMAIARHIPKETSGFRNGDWQKTIGVDLRGKTLGVIGLGNIGKKIASIAKAFDMNVIAWSENLTEEAAASEGVQYVSKETLFSTSDFITIHMVLSDRSLGIVGAREFALMKPTAYFINTSRGPLVDEPALIMALQDRKIAGAALDVFNIEPLPFNHPFRTLDNVVATAHIGFVTHDTYTVFFKDMVEILNNWLSSQPLNDLRMG